MKTNNLELALRQFEISPENDALPYENHYYNGFSGVESEVFIQHLDGLYNEYMSNLHSQIDMLVLKDTNTALQFLQTKINLFNKIQSEFESKSMLNVWESIRKRLNGDLQRQNIKYPLWRKIKNQRDTVEFVIEMINTQNHFIGKAITELQEIANTYNPQPQQQTITEKQIEKDKWDNALKDYPDIITTFDLEKIFNKDKRTINRWVKEGVITPIDKKKRPHQFRKDDIKMYYLKDRRRNL